MRLFGFGKKKKSLEELTGEFGITIIENPLEGDYEACEIKSSGRDSEDAVWHLLTRAKTLGAEYISPIRNVRGGSDHKMYNVSTVVYRHPRQDPAA